MSTRCILALAGLPKKSSCPARAKNFGPTATAPPPDSRLLMPFSPARRKTPKIDDKRIDNHPPKSCWHADNHASGVARKRAAQMIALAQASNDPFDLANARYFESWLHYSLRNAPRAMAA